MEAEIAGDPLPASKASVSYEMNGIPFGTIVCPVGVDENKQPSPAHAVMKKTWPQPVKLTVDVKQLDTGEKRKQRKLDKKSGKRGSKGKQRKLAKTE